MYNKKYDIYDNINKRTNGELYIGVVGPVRTGKSTFIKNFMKLAVLPNVEEDMLIEMLDELPQAAVGKMIMTTEPKFIPKEGVNIPFGNSTASVRLIDCVGFLVKGATGHLDDAKERMVKTPWFDYEIPFSKAAYTGTKRVISEHATIGMVVTTDGTFGEIPKENYVDALDTTIEELNKTGKPYIIILNTTMPNSKVTQEYAKELATKYNSNVLPLDVNNMNNDDVDSIFETVLKSFPISEIVFDIPAWLMLPNCTAEYEEVLNISKEISDRINNISDSKIDDFDYSKNNYIKRIEYNKGTLSNGEIIYKIELNDNIYYNKLSEACDEKISNERDLLSLLCNLSNQKKTVDAFSKAIDAVNSTGYGFILSSKDETLLDEPSLIKESNKYGVSITAKAPSYHIIKANIKTNISPIIGTKEEAEDLIEYIKNNNDVTEGIWNTNIFGKTIEQTIMTSINQKISNMTNENVEKLKETMEKVINENNGLVCLIV